MKLFFFCIPILLGLILSQAAVHAQTPGLLTFSFTSLPHTSYTASKHVMAIWIENAAGNFIKTRIRNVGNGTKDHLPAWAVKSGGPANNALSTLCNVSGASTGATLSAFSSHTITWDGTNAAGVMVPDGDYLVFIQETWNHGTAGTATRSFSFTKGPTDVTLSPQADANFSNISLTWIAQNTSAINDVASTDESTVVFPNPASGQSVTLNGSGFRQVEVYNSLGKHMDSYQSTGETSQVRINIEAYPSGVYFFRCFGHDSPRVCTLLVAH